MWATMHNTALHRGRGCSATRCREAEAAAAAAEAERRRAEEEARRQAEAERAAKEAEKRELRRLEHKFTLRLLGRVEVARPDKVSAACLHPAFCATCGAGVRQALQHHSTLTGYASTKLTAKSTQRNLDGRAAC